ncbi:MAG TPA: ParA family protein [Rudaea sp.]
MRILCIANQKGGVGKTTLAAGLAGAFAANGARVLLLDLDPHASLSHWFGVATQAPARPGSFDLYQSNLPIADVICDAENGIAIAPAQPSLATLERARANKPGLGRALVRAFEDPGLPYDVALLDCPPTLGVLMVSALASADLVLVPTQTEPLALKSLDGMLKTAAMVERSRGQTLPLVVVPTLYDKRTRAARDSLALLHARTDCVVWHGEIPLDARLREASRSGRSPARRDPSSRGAQALQRLAQWIESGTPRAQTNLAPPSLEHAA